VPRKEDVNSDNGFVSMRDIPKPQGDANEAAFLKILDQVAAKASATSAASAQALNTTPKPFSLVEGHQGNRLAA